MKNTKEHNVLQELHSNNSYFHEAMKELENVQESFWNSLTTAEQLKCFCAVSRRIYKGEVEDRGSYRHVLYTVFGFGSEAYAQAQDAGYLAIHNSIFTAEQERELLIAFAKRSGVANPETAVLEFYMENL